MLEHGVWRVILPIGRPGQLYDLSIREPGQPRPARVRFGRIRVSQREPYRIYPTIHGALSIKDESGSLSRAAPAVAANTLL
jgi:hypothetical protein